MLAFLLLWSCEERNPRYYGADIAIQQVGDSYGFYNIHNNEPFVPRGVNLKNSDGHTLFDVGTLDLAKLEAQIVKLRGWGYNTVRVWINTEMDPGISEAHDRAYVDHDGFTPGYIVSLFAFLEILDEYGMYVIFTIEWPPGSQPYRILFEGTSADFTHHNREYLSPEGHAVTAAFWENFAKRMKQSPHRHHILAYSIQNELAYELLGPQDPDTRIRPPILPYDRDSDGNYYRVVTTADGHTYDLAVREERKEMQQSNMLLFLNTVRDAIKEADEEALVTAGYIVLRHGDRTLDVKPLILSGALDFVDIHIYPHEYFDSLEEYADWFGLNEAINAPVIIGEFGATSEIWRIPPFRRRYEPTNTHDASYSAARDLVAWQIAMCNYDISGWLLWDYDTTRERYYTAIAVPSHGDVPAENSSSTGPKLSAPGFYLSPVVRPDPCSSQNTIGPPLNP